MGSAWGTEQLRAEEQKAMRLHKCVVLAALATTMLVPARAQADWLITPFVGGNFGSDTGNFNMGAAVGYMFRGIFGVELDLSLGRDFFEPEPNPGLVSDSRLGTVMGNLIVGIPVGGRAGAGFRPYATIGFGVIQTKVDDPGGLFDLENNEAGINIGGGAMVFFGNHIGVRGDIRYFRNLTTPEGGNGFNLDFRGFDFWRGTAGVVFRF
jgi:opacity protein-like surface antigen